MASRALMPPQGIIAAKSSGGQQSGLQPVLQRRAGVTAMVADHPAAALVPLGQPDRGLPAAERLPATLGRGVERMAGVAMSDVRVYRNSPRPAEVAAHAFAQGRDIHLAPGEERHLPHEAWHAAQQKQGRVRPTGSAGGAAVNDDARLEREADQMGARALSPGMAGPGTPPMGSTQADGAAGARSPIQRVIKLYNDGKGLSKADKASLLVIAKRLNREVEDATALLASDPMLTTLKTKSGYIKRWRATFKELIDTGSLPEFFFARYGYAVETLAAANMPKRIGGLTITTQVTKGATRPDFVVTNGEGEELGWLDITAYASKGHIFKKQHSGWSSRPFVAEILYDSPSITSFGKGKGKLTKKQKDKLAQINRDEIQREEDYGGGIDEVRDAIQAALQRDFDTNGQLTAGRTQQVVKAALDELFNNLTVNDAGELLRLVDTFDLNGEVQSGPAWANWAFARGGYAEGRRLAIALGKLRREEFDD